MTIKFNSRPGSSPFMCFYLFVWPGRWRLSSTSNREMQEEDFNRDFYRAIVSDVLHQFKSVIH